MEMFTITFGYPGTPFEERAPRRIGDRLGKVSVFDHVTRFKFLRDNRIKPFVVKQVIDGFRDKVKALTHNDISLLGECVFRLIPPMALVLLTGKGSVQAYQLLFGLAVKARIEYFLTSRGRQRSNTTRVLSFST